MLTNPALEVTIHAHVLPVVTVNVAVPPTPATLSAVLDNANEQVAAGGVGVGAVGDFLEHAANTTTGTIKPHSRIRRTGPPRSSVNRAGRAHKLKRGQRTLVRNPRE